MQFHHSKWFQLICRILLDTAESLGIIPLKIKLLDPLKIKLLDPLKIKLLDPLKIKLSDPLEIKLLILKK